LHVSNRSGGMRHWKRKRTSSYRDSRRESLEGIWEDLFSAPSPSVGANVGVSGDSWRRSAADGAARRPLRRRTGRRTRAWSCSPLPVSPLTEVSVDGVPSRGLPRQQPPRPWAARRKSRCPLAPRAGPGPSPWLGWRKRRRKPGPLCTAQIRWLRSPLHPSNLHILPFPDPL